MTAHLGDEQTDSSVSPSSPDAAPASAPTRTALRALGSRWTILGLCLTAAFVVLTIGPALIGRGVLLDVGILSHYMPWRVAGVAADSATNYCRGDTVDTMIPQIAEIRRGLAAGDFPTWSPYAVGGTPLAAEPNGSVFDPVMWPLLVMPLWLAPSFARLLQVLVAVAGMVAFLRRHGVRSGVGMVAGIVYASSGFMVMWSGWPHPAVACWIPALFWALDRATCERSPRDVAAVGLIFACMILGGFPAVVLYALTAAAVYVVARAVQAARVGGWPAFLGGGLCTVAGLVLGAGLAAFQLLPFTKNIGAILAERIPGGALPIGQFLTTLAPEVHGLCVGGRYTGPVIPIEGVSYLGVAAATLAVLAVARALLGRAWRAPVRLLAAILVVIVVVLWFGGPILHVLQQLPGYDTNAVSRGIVMFGFLGATLCGFGLELLVRGRAPVLDSTAPYGAQRVGRRWSERAPGVALAVTFVAATIALVVWSWHAARADAAATDSVPAFDRALRGPAIVLALAALALAAALQPRMRRLRIIAPIVLALLVVGQSVDFNRAASPINAKRFFYPQTPAHSFLQDNIGGDRYAGGSAWGSAATPLYYGLRSPVGHAFTTRPWAELFSAIDPDTRITQTYSAFPAGVRAADVGHLPLLDQFAVKYWATYPSDLQGTQTANRLSGEATRPTRLQPQQHASCRLPGGPLRGIAVTFPAGLSNPPPDGFFIHARLTWPGGTVDGEQLIDGSIAPGARYRVALAGEDVPRGADVVAQLWFSSTTRTIPLAATTTGLACDPIRPVSGDGLRLVFADAGALIYQRSTALPRIRWAGRSVVRTDPQRRVALMEKGLPDGVVVLSNDRSPAAHGSRAQVDVTRDGDEQMAVTVNASGAGYLVVADSIDRVGWQATVDGRPTPIVQADHAFAGVPVATGTHRVEIWYTAPGLRTGVKISMVAVVLTALLLVLPVLRRRRRGAVRRRE